MTSAISPSPQDLNVALLVRDSVPSRIRSVQREIAEIEARKTALVSELKRLVDTAVLYGIDLCPQQGAGPAARASEPGGTDTPPGLAGTDGAKHPRAA
ncbi:MAG: hypothetical protein C0503_02795 [Gemmatimonas sp.]|nr:hypothetical protein [Gemmatimonas sp.]